MAVLDRNRKKKKKREKNPIFAIAFIRHGVDYGRVARRWKLQLILIYVASLTTVMHNETDGEWNMKRHELFQIASIAKYTWLFPLKGKQLKIARPIPLIYDIIQHYTWKQQYFLISPVILVNRWSWTGLNWIKSFFVSST